MKVNLSTPRRYRYARLSLYWRLGVSLALILILSAAVKWLPSGEASPVAPVAPVIDTCLTGTIINPASLPFTDDSSTVGATNDLDPGPGGCAPGTGVDVVYRFTPTETDVYTIGATPSSNLFDVSLYVVTDCSNPAGTCVAGSNILGIGRSETITTTLTAGIAYFIIIDGAFSTSAGDFHFALRRGTPANDDCSSPQVIAPSQLPFITSATTFGASGELNPRMPCLRSNQAGRGPEVLYRFVPTSTQTYVVRVTPVANYDPVVYIVTNCSSLGGCSSADVGGAGEVEELRRPLTAGVTYFIVVDAAEDEAGDFQLEVEPTIPIAPAAPTNLVATAASASQVNLGWQDNADNERGFRVERSLDGSNFVQVGTTDPNDTTFSDTTVTANTTFFYRVFAFNNFGSSAPSNIASATTPQPPPPPEPVIVVTPDSIDFGTVSGSQPQDQSLSVSNAGGANLVITAITDPAAPFSIINKPALPLTIAPGQSIQLTVRFAPTGAQPFAGLFIIQSNAPAAPFFTVNLRGVGTSAAVPNLDFGSLLIDFNTGESAVAIEVRNTGNADLLISSVRVPQPPFSISGVPAEPITLEPGENFVMTISFSPGAPGVFVGVINFINNDPDQTVAVLRLKGTSTLENERLKLKAPTLVTAVAGQSLSLNLIAVNGTNSDIQLTASSLPNGTFTNNGGGRGSFTYSPAADMEGNVRVTFTARDSANRAKNVQSLITILPAASTHNIRVGLTAPETASNAPTGVTASDLTITPLGLGFDSDTLEPAVAAGLVGYAIYRSTSPGFAIALSNIVGVIPATQSTFIDTVPVPPDSTQRFFYKATAVYQTGIESGSSNEASSGPTIVGLQFRQKGLRFQAAGSNFAAGAVLIINGNQTFTLQRSGDFIVVDKNARSTPGNQRVRDLLRAGSTITVQGRNPNGATSNTVSLSR